MKRALVVLALLMTACTELKPWRVAADGSAGVVRPRPDPLPSIREALSKYEKASIEDYAIDYKTDDGGSASTSFTVGVIEFDDRGRYWSEEQARSVLAMIEDLAAKPAGVTVIAHGWQHGAYVCDRDIACFRQLLGQLAIAEAKLKRTNFIEGCNRPDVHRPIVGVYLGWRGESIRKSGWNVFSFYNRKSAAHTIGNAPNLWQRIRRANRKTTTDAAQTIARLDSIYRQANTACYKMSLVTVGHSFGGALLYSTVEHTLENQLDDFMSGNAATVRGIGDLVVLVNPAFEAQRFRKLDTGRRQHLAFPPSQSPVLLTVQSDEDGFNLWAFTAGRTLTAWMYPPNNFARFARSRRAIGYYSPIRTHELRLKPGASQDEGSEPPREACGCPWNLSSIDASAFTFTESERAAINANPPAAIAQLAAIDLTRPRDYGDTNLDFVAGKSCPENYPFPVVKAFGALIPSHSEIFTRPFTEFVIRYVSLSRAKRASVARLQPQAKETPSH